MGVSPIRESSVADGTRRETARDVQHEHVLRLAVERLPDHAIVTLDSDGRISSWNVGAERLFGRPRDQVVGDHISSVLGAGGLDSGIDAKDLEDAQRQGSVTMTRRLNHHDSGARQVRTTVVALRNETDVLGFGLAAHVLPTPPLGADGLGDDGRAGAIGQGAVSDDSASAAPKVPTPPPRTDLL